jgi:hypothetical protein
MQRREDRQVKQTIEKTTVYSQTGEGSQFFDVRVVLDSKHSYFDQILLH